MRVSAKGVAFTEKNEGLVTKAYKDPVGVWTIGAGFTNGSQIITQELGKITRGMTITKEKARELLERLMNEEYGPPVETAMVSPKQHQFDAGVDYAFNCGIGATKDTWFKLFRDGDLIAAAERLRRSRITAKGKYLRGLAIRREATARVLVSGDYGAAINAMSEPTPEPVKPKSILEKGANAVLAEYQGKLAELGYYTGKVDGWNGPKTSAAVLAFQKNHPDLKDDGILGPATKAQIDRQIQARRSLMQAAVTLVPAAAASAWFHYLLAAVALLFGLYVAWKWRDEIIHWWKG
jgi:lysozyme